MPFKKWLNDHNLIVSCLVVSVLVALLKLSSKGLYVSAGFPYFVLENRVSDWVARTGQAAPRDDRICFLFDDDASHNLDQVWAEEFEQAPILKKMKARPWSREVFAAILERLAGAGARVVGFDYVYRGEVEELDPKFKAVLDRYRDRVVVGSQFDDAFVSRQRIPQLNPPSPTLIPSVDDPRVGFVNIFPDEDQIVRRFQFRLNLLEWTGKTSSADDKVYESLPARILTLAGHGDRVPPGRGKHLLRFAYRGETRVQMMRPESLANIFIPAAWEANYQSGAFFKDKIVLIGPTGNLEKDVFNSPFGIIGGPEAHLNVMHGLLSGAFLYESPEWMDLVLVFAGGLLALLAGWAIRNPLARIALVALVALASFRAAVWLFDRQNLVIPIFSPLLSLVGSSFTYVVWQQIIERLEKAKLRRTFERYVSRDVVKELVDNPESYLNTVVGVRKAITVLFSDVRGFTTITESGDPQPLFAQLNEYFDAMVGIVFDNRGTLDKFIGDAVMAQWGGITTEGKKQDAINAVRSAVQMRKKLAELNPKWIAQGKIEFKVGIGINHGEAMVGNLGSTQKSEISVIGDVVNTASRLEGMTKTYHCDLLMGETVAEQVRDAFLLRTVALSQPKGTTRQLEIFTVLEERKNGSTAPDWLEAHEEGVRLYRNREFETAAERFRVVAAAQPNDWLTQDYLERCEVFVKSPPPDEWNAVDVMTSK